MSRQQEQWRVLQEILGQGISQAYWVRPGAQSPQLAFHTRTRAALETAGVRIGLAETTLVVDAHGAYRGQVTYHVNNFTRQFFEIRLPDEATLWTAIVAGEPVKPIQVPATVAAAESAGAGVRRRLVRIPLVKTAAGDLDYPVVLKYGGEFGALGRLSKVEFPLLRTSDIEVELSQVRLYLPETHLFFRFGGTMRLADEEDDLVAGRLSYETKQAQRLMDTMQQADDFAKVRAQNNLKQLGLALGTQSQARSSTSERVQQELAQNSAVFQNVDKELKKFAEAPTQRQVEDNRDRLNDLYQNQRTSRAKNVVKDLGRNSIPRSMAMPRPTRAGRRATCSIGRGWRTANWPTTRPRPALPSRRNSQARRPRPSKRFDSKTGANLPTNRNWPIPASPPRSRLPLQRPLSKPPLKIAAAAARTAARSNGTKNSWPAAGNRRGKT